MKKTTLTLIMMLASCMAFSQGVAINEDGTAPHASAMLEVTSTEKGVLIPRMTQAERDAIAEPASGLLIYQNDETTGFYYNAGTPATPDWQMVGSNAGTFSQWTDSGNNIYFNEGNVGIGLDNPQHQLHINLDLKAGEGRFGSIPQNILGLGPDFYGGETGLFDIDADKLIAGKDYTSGVYQYGGTPGSSEGLFINSGKVGIGIQNPEQKLHVAGNAYFGDNYPLAIAYDLVYGELGLFKVDKDLLIAGILNPGQTELIYQYGGFAGTNEGLFIKSGNVGIGIQDPTQMLDIDGLVRIRKGDPGPGKVLTSDADGVASWEIIPESSNWTVNGDDIFRSTGKVGIGTNLPEALLDVAGGDAIIQGMTVGRGSGSMQQNTVIGNQALHYNTDGDRNTAIGYWAMYGNYTGGGDGDDNTALGWSTLTNSSTGSRNTALGSSALSSNNIGHNNVAVGYQALIANSGGSANVALGYQSGHALNGGNNNILIGYRAGNNITTGDNNIVIGNDIEVLPAGSGQMVIGDPDLFYGDLTTNRIGIGTSSPTALLHTYGTGQGQGNVLHIGEYKSSDPGPAPIEGPGTRMMWYPDKAAFRAGYVDGAQWDTENIGNYSFAWGYNTNASGAGATAWGWYTTASGVQATAWGGVTTASGPRATAWGSSTTASGALATAWGQGTTAPSLAESALGRFNTTYTPAGGALGWNANDRLFVIGNGTSDDDRSDALVLLKNGNMGLGTSNPGALLHTYGTGVGQGNVLHVGEYKFSDPGPAPIEGAGTRMMWYPDKAAFRVGRVTGNQWNTENIGLYSMAWGTNTEASESWSVAWGLDTKATEQLSTAWGLDTKATEQLSTAWGWNTEASGGRSTTWGQNTKATEQLSTAWGWNTEASGKESTAWGWNTEASGTASTAWGNYTTAPSAFETALGHFNTIYTPASATGWNANDRLFVIGNGTSSSARSNAMTVLKNGNIGIGTDEPESNRLRVISSASGSAGATGYFENEDDSGIAIRAVTDSDDGTMLVTQRGEGYSLRLDGYDPDWFVAMIVKGKQVGINTTSLGDFNLAVNGSAAKDGGGSWSSLSDARLKTINGNYTKGLNEIVALQAVNFHYIEDNPYGFDPESAQIGFIAQEVREIFPEAVSTGDDGYLNFNMHAINVALVNAIKELKLENDKLKTENDKLRSTDEQLISRIERLEMLIASFSENQ